VVFRRALELHLLWQLDCAQGSVRPYFACPQGMVDPWLKGGGSFTSVHPNDLLEPIRVESTP
jgi:hypothetical protein